MDAWKQGAGYAGIRWAGQATFRRALRAHLRAVVFAMSPLATASASAPSARHTRVTRCAQQCRAAASRDSVARDSVSVPEDHLCSGYLFTFVPTRKQMEDRHEIALP